MLGRCMQRHRHQEFIRFLNAIEAAVPAGRIVHVILDNYATHKHPRVLAWLSRHPRFVFHFTPTACRGKCGPPIPIASSPPSNVVSKRWREPDQFV